MLFTVGSVYPLFHWTRLLHNCSFSSFFPQAIKKAPGCIHPLVSRILPYVGPILNKVWFLILLKLHWRSPIWFRVRYLFVIHLVNTVSASTATWWFGCWFTWSCGNVIEGELEFATFFVTKQCLDLNIIVVHTHICCNIRFFNLCIIGVQTLVCFQIHVCKSFHFSI